MGIKIFIEMFSHSRKIIELEARGNIANGSVHIGYHEVLVLMECSQ